VAKTQKIAIVILLILRFRLLNFQKFWIFRPPETKLTLTMLGAFAEFERAKITERMTRGRLHRLRMGELSSTGHRIYGYHYVKKTPDAPASLVINEEQAAIVRSIFEMFASGNYGIVNISRYLEERRIPTRTGRAQWDRGQIKFMLKNETYGARDTTTE